MGIAERDGRQKRQYEKWCSIENWSVTHFNVKIQVSPNLPSPLKEYEYLPPVLAEEVIFSVASFCLSVGLFALCRLNRWTYGPKIFLPCSTYGSCDTRAFSSYLWLVYIQGCLWSIFIQYLSWLVVHAIPENWQEFQKYLSVYWPSFWTL